MKVKLFMVNWSYVSIFLITVFLFGACKKYKLTEIRGRLLNVGTNKGVEGEIMILKSYAKAGFLLPDKANVELITTSDNEGYFTFSFEAYTPYRENKRPSYGVEIERKVSARNFYGGGTMRDDNRKIIDFSKIYNVDPWPVKHIENLGKENIFAINVIIFRNLNVYCYNERNPVNDSDVVKLQFINKFGIFTCGYYEGKLNGKSDGYNVSGLPIIADSATIRATIYKKNGLIEIRDTTIFVEDKEYNLVYRY
jgi:hypothetical protein